MDFLKKKLAPLSTLGWREIENRAKEILETQLTARRFIKVVGPIGKDKGGINTGRLEIKKKDGLNFGIYQFQPFVENRISFKLSRWELDNIERGAKDINLDSLEEAIRKAAKFEEDTIYKGLEEACIIGLLEQDEMKDFGETEAETIKNVMYGVSKLRNKGYHRGPYKLVVSLEKFIYLNTINENSSLVKKLERVLGTSIQVCHNIKEAILLPYNDPNIELTLGEDFSIGYQEHTEEEVKLFITDRKSVV